MSDLDNIEFELVFILCTVKCYNEYRERQKLTRSAILPPRQAPWLRLLNFGDDQSFLVMTTLTRTAFMAAEKVLWPSKAPQIRGRPCCLDNRGKLGLYLFYVGSRCCHKHLCLLFGIVPSVCQDIVTSMIRLVCKKLSKHPHSQIKFPNETEKVELARIVRLREPLVNNIIGFSDGLTVLSECNSDREEQNAFYNGYYHDTCVNNVFLFSAIGKICLAAINYPGSWHDSEVARQMIVFILKEIGDCAICVDQGFPRSGDVFDKLVGPLSRKQMENLGPILRDTIIAKVRTYVSLRQGAEWGMRGLQGSYPRLKSRLTSHKQRRYYLILSIVLIYNFRTAYVGLNQIATVFNPEYDQYINLEGYERLERFFPGYS